MLGLKQNRKANVTDTKENISDSDLGNQFTAGFVLKKYSKCGFKLQALVIIYYLNISNVASYVSTTTLAERDIRECKEIQEVGRISEFMMDSESIVLICICVESNKM